MVYALDPQSGVTRRALNLRLPEFGGLPERLAADEHTLIAACPSSGKLCWLDPDTGNVLATAVVEKLADITLLPDGEVYAISGEHVVALSRANTAPRLVISDLISPTRLSFDAVSANLFIAEGGGQQQITRYDKDLELYATYGRAGGRRQGRYHPEDFLGITGIAGDGKGGFVVTEGGDAPPRTAHCNEHGAVLCEWYGGQEQGCTATTDPMHPEMLWFDAQQGWIVQAKVNFHDNTWQPYATYRYVGLAGDLTAEKPPVPRHWQVCKHGKMTFFALCATLPLLAKCE